MEFPCHRKEKGRLIPKHMNTFTMQTLRFLSAAVITLAVSCSPSQQHNTSSRGPIEREIDLGEFFMGTDPVEATFVVLNARTGEILRYNPAHTQRRFIPVSTFKIPLSLIAIELGVASGPDHLIPWDNIVPTDGTFWTSSWSRDHTLRSAFQNSVFWYYQRLAEQIGPDRMRRYLDQFNYGNRSMDGGLNQFWLHGDLRISPDEQVRFLKLMYDDRLGLSGRTTQILKDILVLEARDDYLLSGKTGTENVTPTRELAWLVGYVEHPSDTWFFALNMEGEQVWERWGNPTQRIQIVRQLLKAIDIL